MKIIITENQLKKILLNENTYTKSDLTFNDIWFCNKMVKCYKKQDSDNSPLYLVQKRLLEELNKNSNTEKWPTDNNFTTDKSFGPTTAKAIGMYYTNGKREYECPVNIGRNLLTKLGFEPPEELTEDEKKLAITLTMEMSSDKENEIKAISNIIANRAYIRDMGPVDVVLESSQFSGWNKYGSTDVDDVMCKERSYNKKSWKTAVKYAKLLLSGANFLDNTKGATHYYNTNDPYVKKNPPNWGEKSKTWVPHIKLIHSYGRDTTTKWAEKPVKRN